MDKITLVTKFANYVERHRITGMYSRNFIELQRSLNTNTVNEQRTHIIHTLQRFVNNLFFANADKKQFHICVSLLNKLFELCHNNDKYVIQQLMNIFDEKFIIDDSIIISSHREHTDYIFSHC